MVSEVIQKNTTFLTYQYYFLVFFLINLYFILIYSVHNYKFIGKKSHLNNIQILYNHLLIYLYT